MNEFVNRIGGERLIQITIDMWNSLFLLVIFIMVLNCFWKEREQRFLRDPIPLTTELMILCIAVFFYNMFDAVSLAFNGDSSGLGRIWKYIGEYGYFTNGIILLLFFLEVIRRIVAGSQKNKAAGAAITVIQSLQSVNLILLASNPFFKKLFVIDSGSVYARVLPGYYIWSGINIFSVAAAGLFCVMSFRKMDKFQKHITAVSVGITLAGVVCNLFIYTVSLHSISVSLITICLFMVYFRNRTEIMTEDIHRIEQLRTGLILSQVSPHFIHNSITAIIYYADKDTEKTRSALINFSKYLRNNLDYANNNSLTSIEEEIEHAKIYLSLEELRFGEDLKGIFDLHTESFKLPVLTIQPLVENAVKHGIKGSDNGCGTVTIRTEETENSYMITVADDGTGFDTGTLDCIDSKHTGIRSVRSRLRLFSGGTLTVESAPGKGTVCRITIPRQEDQNENTNH